MKWIKKMKAKLLREIAQAVRQEMSPSGWEKFLPPVALRDQVILVTETGTIYVMRLDDTLCACDIIKVRSI